MKWIYAILIGIIVIIISGYFYLHSKWSAPAPTKPVDKNGKTIKDSAQKQSVVDFEPLVTTKLKQLVRDGSHGLYHLSLENLKIDLVQSKIDITGPSLIPDTLALKELEKKQQAPDDVYKITLRSLHIDNIGIKDLLFHKSIGLGILYINHPTIEIYHRKLPYNAAKREDTTTLYQRLTQLMNKIAVQKIVLQHCTFIHHNLTKNTSTKFNDVSLRLDNLLIDSTTQHDKQRFLFAKDAVFSFQNYLLRTPDSLYFFKIGSVIVSAVERRMTAFNVGYDPRFSKLQFMQKVKVQKERYNINFSKIDFKNINWWDIANEESFTADEASIANGKYEIYHDDRLPPAKPVIANFPHQVLMKLPVPVHIKKTNIQHLDVVYEEYNPKTKKSGTISFNNINSTITNINNIPEEIKKSPNAIAKASGMFMDQIPIEGTVDFNLAKHKEGAFVADVHIAGFDAVLLNPVNEALGSFKINKGILKEATAHISGDNYEGRGKIVMLYDDLHISALKKDSTGNGAFKKKTLTSLIANMFVIKNENPSKDGTVRQPDANYKRKPEDSFFTLIWKVISVGGLKTIGAPTKLAK